MPIIFDLPIPIRHSAAMMQPMVLALRVMDMVEKSFQKQVFATICGLQAQGVDPYSRARHLPGLLPVGPDEIADQSPEARHRLCARLTQALRRERVLGRAGHWTYDLNRHLGLWQALRAETMNSKTAHAGAVISAP